MSRVEKSAFSFPRLHTNFFQRYDLLNLPLLQHTRKVNCITIVIGCRDFSPPCSPPTVQTVEPAIADNGRKETLIKSYTMTYIISYFYPFCLDIIGIVHIVRSTMPREFNIIIKLWSYTRPPGSFFKRTLHF